MRSLGLALLGIAAALAGPAFAEEPSRNLGVQQNDVMDCCAQRPGSLDPSLRIDRPGATYALGDTVRLWASVNESAYVTVLDIGPTGNVKQLFPNTLQTDNHLQAGQVVEIAGPGSGVRLTVGGPVGAELIKIVASTEPTPIVPPGALKGEGTFRQLTDTKDLLRDLEVGLDKPGGDGVKIASRNLTIYTVGQPAGAPAPAGDPHGGDALR